MLAPHETITCDAGRYYDFLRQHSAALLKAKSFSYLYQFLVFALEQEVVQRVGYKPAIIVVAPLLAVLARSAPRDLCCT